MSSKLLPEEQQEIPYADIIARLQHEDRFVRPAQDIKTSYAMDCYFHSKMFGPSEFFRKTPHRPFCQKCGEFCYVEIIRLQGKCFVCCKIK